MWGGQTKELIFDEAVRFFSEKGYSNISIRSITRAAGLNESTAYYYYRSKTEILDEILEVFGRKLERYFSAAKHAGVSRERDGPREYLNRFLWSNAIADDVFMQRTFRIVCMEQFTNEKAGALARDKLHGQVAETLRRALNGLVERGEVPDFDTYSFAVMWAQAMYSSAVLAAHSDSETERNNLREVNAFMLDMAVDGKIPDSDGAQINKRQPAAVATGDRETSR